MDLAIVDLAEISEETIASALKSCGCPDDAAKDRMWVALSCFEYGAQAPMCSQNTSNFHRTFRELAKYSRELSGNSAVREQAMRRPVNKLGSTAEEYMRGDLDSAIQRGLDAGDKCARIMAKMSGWTVEEIES